MYVAVRNTSTSSINQSSRASPQSIHEYRCYCVQCAHALHNENRRALESGQNKDAIVLMPYQRYTAETVHSLVVTIQARLKSASP